MDLAARPRALLPGLVSPSLSFLDYSRTEGREVCVCVCVYVCVCVCVCVRVIERNRIEPTPDFEKKEREKPETLQRAQKRASERHQSTPMAFSPLLLVSSISLLATPSL